LSKKQIIEIGLKVHASNDALVVSVRPISSNDTTPKVISISPLCSIHSFYQIETIIRDTVDIFKEFDTQQNSCTTDRDCFRRKLMNEMKSHPKINF
jgi:hypothetical protein